MFIGRKRRNVNCRSRFSVFQQKRIKNTINHNNDINSNNNEEENLLGDIELSNIKAQMPIWISDIEAIKVDIKEIETKSI